MHPKSFQNLLNWILKEKENTIFGVKNFYFANKKYNRRLFGGSIETPIGPASGPHTQLAQNIVSAYVSGARFFELKTVQKVDGLEMVKCISKPCIKSDDEGYNCEWSTELTCEEARDEYIKAWFLCKILALEYGFGDRDGFIFNISVGYDLNGIKSEKVNTFINDMIDAKNTTEFKNCKKYLIDNINLFKNAKVSDIESISSKISNNVNISTLHGCPPQEIEKIATYLLTEKKLNTFVKCNPTLLGYEYARDILDKMGYSYINFTDNHFKNDLQYKDAVPMFNRLQDIALKNNLIFGLKLTNTFPVDVTRGELPSNEMYMSGKPLFLLTMALSDKLAKEFDGNIRMSFCGGVDNHNIKDVDDAGLFPITVATTLLKSGGYGNLLNLAKLTEKENFNITKVDKDKTDKIVKNILNDEYYKKSDKKNQNPPTEKGSIECKIVCGCCVSVCPNRANVIINVPLINRKFSVHIDDMCNECGNCAYHCVDKKKPYKDNFTIFKNVYDMKDSTNRGFALISKEPLKAQVRFDGKEFDYVDGENTLPKEIALLIKTIVRDYEYLL